MNSFVKTYCLVTLGQPIKEPAGQEGGWIEIKSDNYSALTIMKDQITA